MNTVFPSLQTVMDILLRLFEVIGVLGATFFAARSAKIAQDSVKEIKKQNNPSIVIYVKQKDNSLNLVDLIIKNEGLKSARDIHFKVFKDNIRIISNRKISDAEIIKNGRSVLAGGQEIANPIAVMIGEDYKYLKESRCVIKVNYSDEEGEHFSDSFELDFKGLVDRQVGTPAINEAVNALQDIRKELNSIQRDIKSIANKGMVPLQAEPYYSDQSLEISDEIGGSK